MKQYIEPYITADKLLEFVSNDGGKSYLTNSTEFLKWEKYQMAVAVLKSDNYVIEASDSYGRLKRLEITGTGIRFLANGGYKAEVNTGISFSVPNSQNFKDDSAMPDKDISDKKIKISTAASWMVILVTGAFGLGFYFGQFKFDKDKNDLYEMNQSLKMELSEIRSKKYIDSIRSVIFSEISIPDSIFERYGLKKN